MIKLCPSCGYANAPSALRCKCGYGFEKFKQLGKVKRHFQVYFAGTEIKFSFDAHPEILDTLFRTSLQLNLGQLTYDEDRGEHNYADLPISSSGASYHIFRDSAKRSERCVPIKSRSYARINEMWVVRVEERKPVATDSCYPVIILR